MNKELNKIYLENFALDELYTKLFNDISIKKLSEMLTSYNAEKNSTNKKELEIATEKLKLTSNEIDKLLELVSSGTDGVAFKTIQKKLNELEEKSEYLEGYIKELTTDVVLQISESMIKELIEKSKDFIRTKNIAECRMFIESYIDKVLVFNEHVEIHFKIRIPSNDGSGLVSLVSSGSIATLQKEYKIAK